ncbi:RbsD/FucU domain-containing protein [Propionicimonas sp.]|uniref:RbsD/FucU family protein n=1 Tax=Propionicimonas sp. TaxID=1955623 RepID=UPI00181C6D02|nr:RbsD/FucU domain-containing protein [Propionicimonas sp.]MBU3975670.1 fucose-binding protein [Actinomycetota bacterium]MBA3019927.1 fucose-binding protein [Propionicimonas sp.]MBU3986181.1 fucose-binding protein [Actinomycetota bacterium]MBU4007750.1 fucose-binding protein [Actinomycetota bacterium]MBU4064008.1 fucose-binding protein [Actinomycetota bacterium]
MLKGLDVQLVPQLLLALAEMGHGDLVAVVDRNFPAHSSGARVVELPQSTAYSALDAVLSVLPIDRFGAAAVVHMLTDDGLESPATPEVRALWELAEGGAVAEDGRRRMDGFYELAEQAYVTVRTGETLPYACYLIRKGTL